MSRKSSSDAGGELPPPPDDEARSLAHRLCALSGGDTVRRKAALRELLQRPPEPAMLLLDALVTQARAGSLEAHRALGAFLAAFGQEPEAARVAWKLRALAEVRALDSVTGLLGAAPPLQEYHPEAAARADARAFTESLGHLKTKARVTRSPDELARLIAASNREVVRNALINPRLTEDLVVRIAAKRPSRPEPLEEIWRSRWGSRHSVRRALVFNPYLAPEVGTKILPLLTEVDLRELARDMGLHPKLRAQALTLLEPQL